MPVDVVTLKEGAPTAAVTSQEHFSDALNAESTVLVEEADAAEIVAKLGITEAPQ